MFRDSTNNRLKNKVEAIAKVVERNENSTGERKNSTKERERDSLRSKSCYVNVLLCLQSSAHANVTNREASMKDWKKEREGNVCGLGGSVVTWQLICLSDILKMCQHFWATAIFTPPPLSFIFWLFVAG